MHVFGTIVAVSALLTGSQPAPSPGPDGIAVLPLVLAGEYEPNFRDRLTAGLLQGLSRSAMAIIPPDGLPGSASESGCNNPGCMAEVAAATGATYVVQGKISLDDRDYSIEIVLADPQGRTLSTLTESCDICGIDEATNLVADLAGAMLSKLEVLTRGAPVVSITSTPSGAKVFVDDTLVGMTPYVGDVADGKHKVRVELDGYISRDRRVTGVEGTRVDLEFELDRAPVDMRRRKRLVSTGGLSVGLGVAMVGGGIPLMVLNNRQKTSDCDGSNVDLNGVCRYSYDTLAGGLSLVVGGAVLTAVGAALLTRARIDRKNFDAQAVIGPRGLAIAGHF